MPEPFGRMSAFVVDADGFLFLTDSGREIAEKIYERHQFFTEQLKAFRAE